MNGVEQWKCIEEIEKEGLIRIEWIIEELVQLLDDD
jgi:hypothetical protein